MREVTSLKLRASTAEGGLLVGSLTHVRAAVVLVRGGPVAFPADGDGFPQIRG